MASAAHPDGPWERTGTDPILEPDATPERFDSHRVDDSCLVPGRRVPSVLQGPATRPGTQSDQDGPGHRGASAQNHDPLSRMITGRFGDSTGRPYVEAIVWFPRFLVKAQVSFLVDTGADISLINPVDGIQGGIPYGDLAGERSIDRIGGPRTIFVEPVLIFFAEEPNTLHRYHVRIGIAEPDSEPREGREDMRSLVGRDVLDTWRMDYDPCHNRLSFEVLKAHHTIQLSPP